MSMYDLVAGDGNQRNRGDVLLAVLGNPNVGRYRDSWVERGEDGEPVIAVYTRNGGGNRECWCDGGHPDGPCTALIATEVLPAHPLYLRDADDAYDCTYATFYFKVPDEYREALAEVAGDPVALGAAGTDATVCGLLRVQSFDKLVRVDLVERLRGRR